MFFKTMEYKTEPFRFMFLTNKLKLTCEKKKLKGTRWDENSQFLQFNLYEAIQPTVLK